jgi:hypothetical protein
LKEISKTISTEQFFLRIEEEMKQVLNLMTTGRPLDQAHVNEGHVTYFYDRTEADRPESENMAAKRLQTVSPI